MFLRNKYYTYDRIRMTIMILFASQKRMLVKFKHSFFPFKVVQYKVISRSDFSDFFESREDGKRPIKTYFRGRIFFSKTIQTNKNNNNKTKPKTLTCFSSNNVMRSNFLDVFSLRCVCCVPGRRVHS